MASAFYLACITAPTARVNSGNRTNRVESSDGREREGPFSFPCTRAGVNKRFLSIKRQLRISRSRWKRPRDRRRNDPDTRTCASSKNSKAGFSQGRIPAFPARHRAVPFAVSPFTRSQWYFHLPSIRNGRKSQAPFRSSDRLPLRHEASAVLSRRAASLRQRRCDADENSGTEKEARRQLIF